MTTINNIILNIVWNNYPIVVFTEPNQLYMSDFSQHSGQNTSVIVRVLL